MKHRKKFSSKAKKGIIVGLLCLIALLIFMIITTITYFLQNETNGGDDNILYYSEKEDKDENNMLVVEIENKNETNENNELNNTTNENNTNNANENNVSKETPYYIKINNQANTVTIYKKDSNGEYTVPVKAMVCSIGDATPESGVYSISDKYTWRLLQGDVYGQYACRITGHILFHSVPYSKKDKSTLEWWEYDKLGTKASLGCIRLTVQDAKWIYDNCTQGTKVEFYSASNPGPLGKPTAKKISDDEEVRNWDPTDPDKKNPWKNYKPNSNKTNTNQSNTNNTNENKTTSNETDLKNTVDASTNVATENIVTNEVDNVTKNDTILQ